MKQIIKVDKTTVSIGTEDMKIIKVPRNKLNYDDPQIGDTVVIYGEDPDVIVTKEGVGPAGTGDAQAESDAQTGADAQTEGGAQAQAEDPGAQTGNSGQAEDPGAQAGSANNQNASGQYYESQNRTIAYPPNEKHINKHIFVWVGTFLFGGIGVDRFLRGQVGLGILKLITAGGLGIWALVDFIIGLVKVYGEPFGLDENVVFVDGQYAR